VPAERELRGITWDHPRGRSPLEAAARAWNLQRGVDVVWEARSLNKFGDAPLPELARDYDLLVIDHPHVGTAVAANVLEPFDDYVGSEFLADQAANSVGRSHESYRHANHQWALAIDAAAQVSVARADLLAEAGADWPVTWADVDALIERFGAWRAVAVPLTAAEGLCCYLSLAANRGGSPGEGQHLLPRDEGLAALEHLGGLVERLHPASLNLDPIAALDLMTTSDQIAYMPLTFGYTNYSREHCPRPVVFGDVPSSGAGPIGAVLGGSGLAVSAQSSRREDAVEFASFAASGPVQRGLYVDAAGQPAHRSAWLDTHANEITNGFFTRTLTTIDGSFLRPTDPGWLAFQLEAAGVLHDCLLRRASPPAAYVAVEESYRRHRSAVGSHRMSTRGRDLCWARATWQP
jgi:multiple sugar transport system substrate-binding protein